MDMKPASSAKTSRDWSTLLGNTGKPVDRAVTLISVAEAATGILLLVAPGPVSGQLFGTAVSGSGAIFAQLFGIALLCLGLACLQSQSAIGLLIYGLVVGVFLAWVGTTQGAAGPLLWPAIILHAALVVPLYISIRRGRTRDV